MAFQYGAIGILPSLGLPNTVARSQQYEMATRRIGRNARRLANFTTEYERLRHIGKIDPERANNANEYAEGYLRPPAPPASAPPAPPRSYSAVVGAPAHLSDASVAGGDNVQEETENENSKWSVVSSRGGRGGGGGGGGGSSVISGRGGSRASVSSARNMSKGFFSAKRIVDKSGGAYHVQVQISPVQAGAIIGIGGATQQDLQKKTRTGISVLDGNILQVRSRIGKKEDVEEALRRIGNLLMSQKTENRRMTLRKRKNQKTRKNRR